MDILESTNYELSTQEYPCANYWRLLEIIGDFWRSLATFGDHWRLLEIIGDFWRSLATFGDHWRLLEVIGDFWRSLERSLQKIDHKKEAMYFQRRGTLASRGV